MTQDIQTVKIGFIPLVDCALLVIAKEKGFAQNEGIDLQLFKEVSWANIRDKVYLGYLDGAQMLAGMPIAANMGLMQTACEIVAPFVLGRNGNAITVSHPVFANMQNEDPDFLKAFDLKRTGAALKAVVARRKKEGQPILRFGMVFPFSCHYYHLRYWMAACGIEPDVDVHLEVIPPPFMDQYLGEGRIDGFCVGEPWSSLVVAQDIGVIVGATTQIWSRCPEKLLGLRKDWIDNNPIALQGLIKALHQSSVWAGDMSNMEELSQILSTHNYIDVPAELIIRALTGDVRLQKGQPKIHIPDFLTLSGRGANYPDPGEGQWILAQMERWGQANGAHCQQEGMNLAFCADLYEKVLPSSAQDVQLAPKIILFDDIK